MDMKYLSQQKSLSCMMNPDWILDEIYQQGDRGQGCVELQ